MLTPQARLPPPQASESGMVSICYYSITSFDTEDAGDLLSRTQEMLDEGCKKADNAYLRVERGIRWPSKY